jgi:D-glycero-alpha-D-manno-heptose-7-phosphate kinase
MIVTKTPLRVSFFGGGSDIPEFYQENEGLCVSTTINSYIYLAVNRCVADHLKVVYSELELTDDIENIKHNRVREVLKHYDLTSNMEICSFSDMPTKGTGLGSSSTFTVGLINAVHRIKYNKSIDQHTLAELASYIEIEKCGEPIGKQDQFASAYGGLREYRFNKYDVYTKPVPVSFFTLQNLNNNILFFNTGTNRLASSVLTEQVENLKQNTNVSYTKTLVNMAENSIKFLESNKLDDFGALLNDAWTVKKKLSSNVSNERIDDMYERCMKNGALGGKILGAGGGGYLMVYVPEKQQNRVMNAMTEFKKVDFQFVSKGSTIEMRS